MKKLYKLWCAFIHKCPKCGEHLACNDNQFAYGNWYCPNCDGDCEKISVSKSISKTFPRVNEFGVEGYGNTFKNNKLAFKEDVPYYSKTWSKCLHPATKEQRDTLMKAMADAGYTFDFESKELKKVEPKFKVGDVMRTLQEAADGMVGGMPVIISIDKEYYHCTNELIAIKDQDEYEYPPMNRKPASWSEEDNMMIEETLYFLREYQQSNRCKDENGMQNSVTCEKWLKSLKDRYTWKPSDEQIDALEHFVRSIGESGYVPPYYNNIKLLYSLLEQLKKLK